jgi:hypothetical protein
VLELGAEKLSALSCQFSEKTTTIAHGEILTGLEVRAEVSRSRLESKPVQSVTSFATKTHFAINRSAVG